MHKIQENMLDFIFSCTYSSDVFLPRKYLKREWASMEEPFFTHLQVPDGPTSHIFSGRYIEFWAWNSLLFPWHVHLPLFLLVFLMFYQNSHLYISYFLRFQLFASYCKEMTGFVVIFEARSHCIVLTGLPRTPLIDQACLDLTEISLPLHPECWINGVKGKCYHSLQVCLTDPNERKCSSVFYSSNILYSFLIRCLFFQLLFNSSTEIFWIHLVVRGWWIYWFPPW